MADQFDELIESLKDRIYENRLTAIDKLVAMESLVVDRLLPLLHEPQSDDDRGDHKRGHIAEILGRIGDRRAFDVLVEATESQSEFLREKAIFALGVLRDNRAIGLLVAQLRNHWHPDTREEAAWALKHFPEQWVIRALIRAFTDSHDIVRDAATYALVQIGETARAELLKAANSDNPLIREQAKEALAEIENA